jgi:hypothetical protein
VDLRLTRRALADLGLDAALRGRSAWDLIDQHQVIRAFVERRSQRPQGQETTQLPASRRAVVFNLHVGRWRSLTWHDEAEDIVWLLGVGEHRTGDHDDAYEVLKRRDCAATLLPDEDDYADLEPEPRTFVQALADVATTIVEQALAMPGQPVTNDLAGILQVRVLAQPINEASDGAEIWIGFQMPPLRPNALPPAWPTTVVAAFLPNAAPDDLQYCCYPFPGPPIAGTHEEVVYAIIEVPAHLRLHQPPMSKAPHGRGVAAPRVRFERLIDRPVRVLGGPSARAASGGDLSLPWLLLSVVPMMRGRRSLLPASARTLFGEALVAEFAGVRMAGAAVIAARRPVATATCTGAMCRCPGASCKPLPLLVMSGSVASTELWRAKHTFAQGVKPSCSASGRHGEDEG